MSPTRGVAFHGARWAADTRQKSLKPVEPSSITSYPPSAPDDSTVTTHSFDTPSGLVEMKFSSALALSALSVAALATPEPEPEPQRNDRGARPPYVPAPPAWRGERPKWGGRPGKWWPGSGNPYYPTSAAPTSAGPTASGASSSAASSTGAGSSQAASSSAVSSSGASSSVASSTGAGSSSASPSATPRPLVDSVSLRGRSPNRLSSVALKISKTSRI